MKTTKIKNIKLKNRIFLAPMHQINDIAFRMLCKKAGAGLTYTGLINPQTKEKIHLEDKPALQFACNTSKGIKEFIQKYDKKISLYDFNLGCPSPHAKQSKIGYFMTENLEGIEDILKEIKENTKKPITIKIRKMSPSTTKKIIALAEKYCSAIGVHPRTQAQGYSGVADIDFAKWVRKNTKLPIIYSGNINYKEQAEKLLNEFDFIMIGRAAFGNPNIFDKLNDKKTKKIFNFWDWLKLAKRIEPNIYFSQIKFQAINFTRNFEGSARTREKISLAKNEEELIKILKNQ
jgi:tRNA-dihydrouridine synthase B